MNHEHDEKVKTNTPQYGTPLHYNMTAPDGGGGHYENMRKRIKEFPYYVQKCRQKVYIYVM